MKIKTFETKHKLINNVSKSEMQQSCPRIGQEFIHTTHQRYKQVSIHTAAMSSVKYTSWFPSKYGKGSCNQTISTSLYITLYPSSKMCSKCLGLRDVKLKNPYPTKPIRIVFSDYQNKVNYQQAKSIRILKIAVSFATNDDCQFNNGDKENKN